MHGKPEWTPCATARKRGGNSRERQLPREGGSHGKRGKSAPRPIAPVWKPGGRTCGSACAPRGRSVRESVTSSDCASSFVAQAIAACGPEIQLTPDRHRATIDTTGNHAPHQGK